MEWYGGVMTKTIIINGKVVTLYRVRGFVYQSWCSDQTEVERIEERRAREFQALRVSGSRDVRRVLGEFELD